MMDSYRKATIIDNLAAFHAQAKVALPNFACDLYANKIRMRSALVHGGDKRLTNDYVATSILRRPAIAEPLNNEKYTHIKK